jgi:cytochrome oxidase assembly protein ShyY1
MPEQTVAPNHCLASAYRLLVLKGVSQLKRKRKKKKELQKVNTRQTSNPINK